MEWKDWFESKILSRGYEYYLNGCVDKISRDENVFETRVDGNYTYQVRIEMNEELTEVEDMECDCPYADTGFSCKHMAAVMFAIEEDVIKSNLDSEYSKDPGNSGTNNIDPKMDKYLEIIKDITREELEKIVIDELTHNDNLQMRIEELGMIEHLQKFADENLKKIKELIFKYVYSYHFIPYDKADELCSKFEERLNHATRLLVEEDACYEALVLAIKANSIIFNIDMDDSSGCLTSLANENQQFIEETLEELNIKEKSDIFSLMIQLIESDENDSYSDILYNAIMNEFLEVDFLNRKNQWLSQCIESLDSDDSFELDRHLEYQFRVIKQLGGDLSVFYRRYSSYSHIAVLYADECMKTENFDEAIKIYKMLKKRTYRVSYCNERLLRCYKANIQLDEYREILIEMVTSGKRDSLRYYQELKRQYSDEEWVKFREQIFDQVQETYCLEYMYVDERMFDRLLELTGEEKQGGFGVLRRNSQQLHLRYPDIVKQRYYDQINKMVKEADVKIYLLIEELLNELLSLKDAADEVFELMNKWRKTYGNRPAMMKMLDRVQKRYVKNVSGNLYSK